MSEDGPAREDKAKHPVTEASSDPPADPYLAPTLISTNVPTARTACSRRNPTGAFATIPVAIFSSLNSFYGGTADSAHPAGIGYRARKYVRRHRVGVTIAVTGGSTLGFSRMRHLRCFV
jgi:hypothetical protein